MAQVITPALEALLAQKFPPVKVRGEIEIDRITGYGATGSPLLASGVASDGALGSSLATPSISPAGDDVLLVVIAGIRALSPGETFNTPSGWTKDVEDDFTQAGYLARLAHFHKVVASAAPPYSDLFDWSGDAYSGLHQLAFRSTGAQPSNSGSNAATYALPGSTAPTISALLAGAPTLGHVLVASLLINTGGGPYTGSQEIVWPAGWTDLGITTPSAGLGRIGAAYKVSDGTETGITGVYYDSNHVTAYALLITEYHLDPTPEPGIDTRRFQIATMTIDRSRKRAAGQLDATLSNEDGARGWYTGDGLTIVPNNPIRGYAWLGDRDNRVQLFTGLIDRPHEHRNPKTVSIKARSRMKWLLEQKFRKIGPQGADDEGAVRTEANGVYLGKTIEYIVGDILDRAGWPSADRSIDTTGITLSEYVLTDGGSWLEQIAGSDRLTTAAGCDLVEDELGVIRFEASPLVATSEPTPAWDFAAGLNVLELDHEVDDEERATRVEVTGPMTSAVPKWEQVWSTSVLDHPVGAWYDPTDPDYLRVVDRVTKYIYRMRQSDRKLVSKAYLGGYPLGLSGIPGDSAHYLVLHAPWRNTGSTTGNKIRKYAKATNALVATYSLPNGRWSAIKSDGTNIFLTNYDDGKVYKRTMTGGAVSSASTTYNGEVQDKATGMWLNGTTLGVFFSDYKRFLLMDTSALGTVTGVQSTQGTRIAGGEADTDTDIDLYAVASAGSFGLSSGMVAKFTLAELVTTDVSALAIDYDLEDALGFQSGIAVRDHGDCPNDVTDHRFEARLATYSMKVVQSLAQAQDVADAQLALLSRLRRVFDLATTGHPGVQLNDPIGYTDTPAGLAGAVLVVDSLRIQVGKTFTQTMSALPWEAP